MRSTRRRRARRLHGQALVEFALVLPLLVLMFMSVFDFGRYVFAANDVANAAREGARTAIVNQNLADIRERAAAQAISVAIPSGAPASCPASPAGVCVSFEEPGSVTASPQPSACPTPLQVGCNAVVTVTYTYTPITPVISNIVKSIPIDSTAVQPIEHLCTGAGCPTR